MKKRAVFVLVVVMAPTLSVENTLHLNLSSIDIVYTVIFIPHYILRQSADKGNLISCELVSGNYSIQSRLYGISTVMRSRITAEIMPMRISVSRQTRRRGRLAVALRRYR